MRTKLRSRLGTNRGGKEKRKSGYAGSGCSVPKEFVVESAPLFREWE
jgi:hypothetical protein